MSFVGEALVSSAIGVLIQKLASSTEQLQFPRQEQIHADLKKWKEILVKIEAVLADAEEKQTTNQPVDIWLDNLKNLAYDVEDMLEEFDTEALQRKLMDEPQASTGFNLCKFILTCCTRLNPRSLMRNSAMATQIKEIDTRFKEIVEQKTTYGLIEDTGAGSNRAKYQTLPTATSLNEPHIYGRDKDKAEILDMLLKDEGTHAKFSVISIEGMGGLGKSTLANLVYNDNNVKNHFAIRAWASVSHDFNLIQVTKRILQSITEKTSDDNDLDLLQNKLKKELSGKKCLIVLDDVWNEDYIAWNNLCRPFHDGSKGSKIIVTTRNNCVSQKVGALVVYPLKELSDNACLSVFTRHLLEKDDFSEHENLEEIGKKIIEKCAGLPLAAKTLGGLLRGNHDCKQWEEVLKNNIWDLAPEDKSGIVSALKVSYYYLPSRLKQCFAYCSIFPKGHEFQKEDLILLWMAEGFLQPNKKEIEIEIEMEDLGENCFDILHSRSFFQPSTYGFVMHDLIHDLAQWATKDFCYRIENLQEGEKEWRIPEKIRHSACLIDRSNYDNFKESKAFNKMKSVRTFLVLSSPLWFDEGLNDFLCMVLQLQRLRVLSLNGYPISKLPNAIGDMKLLHHLDLSDTGIEFLPDSINTLYNLEALLLKYCYLLKRLCSDMGNLIKLRHLFVDDKNHLEAMPLRIGKLTMLRTLQFFAVGKNMGSGIRELKDLTHLRGRLHISRLENVKDLGDAEKADLKGKGDLKDLVMEWTCSNDGSDEKEIAAQVFEKLLLSQKLESLRIKGYGGTRFSQRLGDTSLSSLVTLKFENCKNCATFPSIGQLPSLKKLVIRNMDGIERLGPEFYGHSYSMAPFQSLEKFKIENLEEWKDWIPCGSGRNVEAFPRLRRLSIDTCPKLLGKLPEHLPSLENLYISNCDALQSLPTAWMHSSNTSLKAMFIKGCNSLTCIGKIELSSCSNLPTLASTAYLPKAVRYHSIQRFTINECEKLETLPCFNNLISLKKLEILNCPAMVSIPEGGFPTSLTSLVIQDTNICKSLFEWGLHRLTSLEELKINGGCPDVMSFPQEEIGMILPVSLKSLDICDFPNLERLSSIAQNLTCLEKLFLSHCPKLKYFPHDGLPQSLKQYGTMGCPLLEERCKEGEGLYWPMIAHLSNRVSEEE